MTVKISELPVATEFESGDVIPIVQDGSTKQLDADGNWTFGAIDGTPIGGSTPSTGAFTSVNIDGGNIDGTPIGANSADEGNFTTLDASGDVTIADKIAHAGDTNTAIRFPSADTVTFETAGTEKVRIDSNGNVGIGTTAPGDLLHVAGRARVPYLQGTKSFQGIGNGVATTVLTTSRVNFSSKSIEVSVLVDGNDGAAVRAAKFIWVTNGNSGIYRRTVLRESITSSSDVVSGNRTISDITATATTSGTDEILQITVTHGGALGFSHGLFVTYKEIRSPSYS